MVATLNLSMNINRAFDTGNYTKKAEPLLARYTGVFKWKERMRLHLPAHVNANHWCLILSILTRRPFDMVSALYYDDCQCLSEVVGDSRAHLDPKPPQKPATEKQTKKIQLWLKKEFGKEFTCEGDKMKHGKQEDTVNCGVYHLNTTEHELFGVEILTHGKRCLARMHGSSDWPGPN